MDKIRSTLLSKLQSVTLNDEKNSENPNKSGCHGAGATSLVATPGQASGTSRTYWAANGKLLGGARAERHGGEDDLGSSYVTGLEADGDGVEVLLGEGLAPGTYKLVVWYRSPFGDKHQTLLLDGRTLPQHRGEGGAVRFPKATGWEPLEAGEVEVTSAASASGGHSLRLVKNWGWMDVRSFELRPSSTPSSSCSSAPAPVPPCAPPATAAATAAKPAPVSGVVAGQAAGGGSPPAAGGGHEPMAGGLNPGPGPELELVAVLQAEQGVLAGGARVVSEVAGHEGQGYVTGMTSPGSSITVTADLPGQGPALYAIWLRYRSPFGDKVNSLSVNGDRLASVTFRGTKPWAVVYGGREVLARGRADITLSHDWGWVDLDAVYVYRCPQPAPPAGPWVPRAGRGVDPCAASLMRFLMRNYGKRVIAGQQASGNGGEFEHIRAVTGRTPALKGFDLLNYTSQVNWKDGTPEEAIKWHQQGGLVTVCWHWFAPDGKCGDKCFYAKDTTFDVEAAVTPGTKEHQLILSDIDCVAAQLRKLRDAGVPVLWRPLHEAEGKWFWWGAKGPGPLQSLYSIVFDRLARQHGLGNLIWVWTASGVADSAEWYPGHDMVDILGADIYTKEGDHGCHSGVFHSLAELGARSNDGGGAGGGGGTSTSPSKLVALTEVGAVPDPESMACRMSRWSWFCVWSGYFATDGKWNCPEALKRLYQHPDVITLEELGQWWADE